MADIDAVSKDKVDMHSGDQRPSIGLMRMWCEASLPKELVVPDEVFKIELAGRRCIILQDEVPERSEGTFGASIIIPPQARSPLGAGWIVNIGHEWAYPGQPPDRSTMYFMFSNRWFIIGKKVLFGDYVGQDLNISLTDRRFQTKFRVLAEHEVWGLVER